MINAPMLQDQLNRLWEQCEARADTPDVFSLDTTGNPRRNGELFGISRETWRFWKANAGNAKTRRRWRRRDIPNRQRGDAT